MHSTLSTTRCRVDSLLKLIGDRWSLGIIHELSVGPRRTLELHSAFIGLSTKTLSDRLKKLEKNGVIRRFAYPEAPPRVEYALTDRGRSLLPIIHAISDAATRWQGLTSTTNCPACKREHEAPPTTHAGRPRSRRDDVTLL
jgi:DNA-binding HxlR family transcriptional regulator